MKQFTLLAACLTTLLSGVVSAHPGHNHERDLIRPRVGINGTTGQLTNSTDVSTADDTIPVFKAATCVCPAPICDSRMSATSICQCKAQAQLACYIKSEGACSKPADNAC